MAPRPAPRSGCPSCPALPLSPQIDRYHREWAVTGRFFQALPTQTDTVALIKNNGIEFHHGFNNEFINSSFAILCNIYN